MLSEAPVSGVKFVKRSMTTSEKWGCREIAKALAAYGIRYIVTSPGSRNSPLLMAVENCGRFKVTPVVDERSAAFIAVGMAEISNEGVAIICTSGSALLDYAPGVSEAYYRHLPLIVISADRPAEWIDQDDSQTIRQPGALNAIVKGTYAIKGEAQTETEKWFINRTLNEALTAALSGCHGPVHINMALSMPLTNSIETEDDGFDSFRKITTITAPDSIDNETAHRLAEELHDKRIAVFCSIGMPSAKLNKAIAVMAAQPNVVVIAEGVSNIHAKGTVYNPETIFCRLSDAEAEMLKPDILITTGGAPVAASWKKCARNWHVAEHWHVGKTNNITDTYMSLTRRIDYTAEGFFPKIANSLRYINSRQENRSTFRQLWEEAAARITAAADKAMAEMEWNAALAVRMVTRSVPERWNLQLSNGMAVRYAMLDNLGRFHRVDSNRGVSGIDGSTSTAVGASALYNEPTLLITGDMSAQYDIGALTSTVMSNRLKIVVINNGGGGIFKFVKTTARLTELDRLLKCELNLPLEKIADAFGMHYLHAADKVSLEKGIHKLIRLNDRPVILEITTDAETDAKEMWKILGK